MLWGTLHVLFNLVLVIAVGVAILIAGLIVAAFAFWILARTLGKLPAEPDPFENEDSSIVPQGDDRVDAGSAPSGNLAGEDRDQR